MNQKNGILVIIAVVLIGIFAIMAVQMHEESETPAEKISEGVSEAFEEAGDEIDDSTTN